jgi:ribosome-binding ATPase YchF (GTP1/OBG family)
MDKLGIKDPLETWDDAMIGKVVNGFLDERFPTVVALNKIDMTDADKNITKIMRKYDPVSNSAPPKIFRSGDRHDLNSQSADCVSNRILLS